MAPYLREGIYQNGDLWNVLGGIVEARNAMAEGQFPVRVAPNQLHGDRYPVFQFYANLPDTLGGLLLGSQGRNTYAAWRWTMLGVLVLGGFCAQRLTWRWTRSLPASLASTVVLLSAPYLMTDLYDRGAVAEAFAICLLPSALLATWSCAARPGLWRAAVCAVAWTAIGLTHNITYLYSGAFAALLFASFLRPNHRWLPRVGRLAVALLLHLLLIAWYIAPQLAVMPHLMIGQNLGTPRGSAELVPLVVLLWPTVRTPVVASIPRLGLQVGTLVLLSAIGAALVLVWRVVRPLLGRRLSGRPAVLRLSRFRTGLILRLLLLWGLAFLVAWQPFDVWPYLPRPFYFVQFSYRLLGFTLLFGGLLSAFVVGAGAGVRSGERWMLAVICGVLAGLTYFAYFPGKQDAQYAPRGAHRWINDKPVMGGLGDYLLTPQPAAPTDRKTLSAEAVRRLRDKKNPTRFNLSLAEATRVTLPVFWYPKMLHVEVDGKRVAYEPDGQHTAVHVGAGEHVVTARFVGLAWANVASLCGSGAAGVLLALGGVSRIRRSL